MNGLIKLIRVCVFASLALASLLNSSTTYAQKLSGFYSVSLPATSQDRALRLDLMRQATRLMLIRLTGDSNIANQESAAAIIKAGHRYVKAFSYEEQDQGLALAMQFSERGLERELRAKGLPVWTVDRPKVLAWIVIEKNGRRFIVDNKSKNKDWRQHLERAARARGLSLSFPYMDNTDSHKVAIIDILGGFDEAIIDASLRYQADHIVVGRLQKNRAGEWFVHWRFYIGPEQATFTVQTPLLDESVSDAINKVADSMAARYAVLATESFQHLQKLNVAGITSLDDYSKVQAYLESIPAVQTVEVLGVYQHQLHLDVLTKGDEQGLHRALENSLHLQRLAEDETTVASVSVSEADTISEPMQVNEAPTPGDASAPAAGEVIALANAASPITDGADLAPSELADTSGVNEQITQEDLSSNSAEDSPTQLSVVIPLYQWIP